MDLDGIKTLSFDCYGTLIDWETGLLKALGPWLKKNNKNPPDEQVLEIYGELEFEVENLSGELEQLKHAAGQLKDKAGALMKAVEGFQKYEDLADDVRDAIYEVEFYI